MFLKIMQSHEYKPGLNVAKEYLSVRGFITEGGINFYEPQYVLRSLNHGDTICEVDIPSNEDNYEHIKKQKRWVSQSLLFHPPKSLTQKETWKWMSKNGLTLDQPTITYVYNWAKSNLYVEVMNYMTELGYQPSTNQS